MTGVRKLTTREEVRLAIGALKSLGYGMTAKKFTGLPREVTALAAVLAPDDARQRERIVDRVMAWLATQGTAPAGEG